MMHGVPATTSASERRPGRPRDTRVDEAILNAAAELIGEHGARGFSVDDVADRAGVGKATIYRRWPSREELLLEATTCLAGDAFAVDTGALRDDMLALFDHLLRVFRRTQVGRVMPSIVGEAALNTRMRTLFRQRMAERRAPGRAAIERAVGRGELPADIDPERTLDLFIGPFFYRFLVLGKFSDRAQRERIVDVVITGLTQGMLSDH